MAWIESHQSLAGHHKTRKAARLLKIEIPALIGHLHLLWWWAIDAAPDSDITKFDAEDLADVMMWKGDPNQMIDALIECRANGEDEVGFLERTDDGRLLIHNWHKFAGKLIEIREKDRERKKADLEKKKATEQAGNSNGYNPDSSGVPLEVQRNSQSFHTDSIRDLDLNPNQDQREDSLSSTFPLDAPVGATPKKASSELPPIPDRSEDVTDEMLRLYATVIPPVPVLIAAYAMRRCWAPGQGQAFFEHHANRDWKPKGSKVRMKNWQFAMNTWERSEWFPPKVDPSVYTQPREKSKPVYVPDTSYEPGPSPITPERLQYLMRTAPGLQGVRGIGKPNAH